MDRSESILMTRLDETFDGQGNLIESIEVPYTKQELSNYLETAYKPRLLQPVTLHGITIVPDDKTLNRLNNKIQAMRHRNDPAETCTWIGENGPATLTLAELEDLGMEANDQWQAVFDALPGIHADIQAGNITDKDGVEAALDGID